MSALICMSALILIVFGKRMKGLSASVRFQPRYIPRMADDDVGWDGRKVLSLAMV